MRQRNEEEKKMRCLLIFSGLLLNACSALMPFADDMEKVLDDDVIQLKVSKDAFAKETDVKINVEILNKESPQGN